jgi:hypothetical protein
LALGRAPILQGENTEMFSQRVKEISLFGKYDGFSVNLE